MCGCNTKAHNPANINTKVAGLYEIEMKMQGRCVNVQISRCADGKMIYR